MSEQITQSDIKVFGRFSDFKAMIDKAPPAAIIAPSETVQFLGLTDKIIAHGVVKGQIYEPMVLLTLNVPMDNQTWSSATVGYVATMDRAAGKKQMEHRLGASAKPNPVTKLEDLLPMLTFHSAHGVLVTSSQAALFQARSQANLVIQTLPNVRQANLAAAALNTEGSRIVGELVKLPPASLELLNVEGWR